MIAKVKQIMPAPGYRIFSAQHEDYSNGENEKVIITTKNVIGWGIADGDQQITQKGIDHKGEPKTYRHEIGDGEVHLLMEASDEQYAEVNWYEWHRLLETIPWDGEDYWTANSIYLASPNETNEEARKIVLKQFTRTLARIDQQFGRERKEQAAEKQAKP